MSGKKRPPRGEVGYSKPPVEHQFKPSQSGCPDDGWKQRRARKAAREARQKAENDKTLHGRSPTQ